MTDPEDTPPAVAVSRVLEPIFDEFLGIQRRHLAALRRAMAEGDRHTFARMAHSMKGACATYGLPDAAALAARLEAAGGTDDWDGAAALAAALARYLDTVRVAFTRP